MFKKFTKMFLIGILILSFSSLYAQEDATISPEDILYWVGEGQNEVVFIVNWNNPDTALAWGYRFNANQVFVKNVMDGIVAEDPRFNYDATSGFVNDIFFQDGYVDLSLYGRWWLYLVNGIMAQGYETQTVSNGDYIKWGDESCAIDLGDYNYIWTKPVVPVFPYAVDATIAFDDIIYWIGEGKNESVFIVNWNNPDTAFAWGYRYDADSVVIKDMMDELVSVDKRLTYTESNSFMSDIVYNDGNLELSLAGDYWLFNVNGVLAMNFFDVQKIGNGDYIKWGDESCATDLGHWNYVWTEPVVPVTKYNDGIIVNNIENNISLYPNPAKDFFNIEGNNLKSVEIYNLLGKFIGRWIINNSNSIIINTTDWPAGVYLINTIDNNNQLIVKKMIIK